MALGLGGRTGFRPSRSPATNDPFYNYNRWQQDNDFDWTKTPVIGGPTGYLEQNPEVAYNRWLNNLGYGQNNTSPYAQWLRNQYQQTQLGFQTALAERPTLTYQHYLRDLRLRRNQDTGVNRLRSQWEGLSARQRGVDVSRFAGPTRTISNF